MLSPFLFAILVDDIAALDNFTCKFHVVLYMLMISCFSHHCYWPGKIVARSQSINQSFNKA